MANTPVIQIVIANHGSYDKFCEAIEIIKEQLEEQPSNAKLLEAYEMLEETEFTVSITNG